MNYFKTFILLVVLTALLIWIGSIFGGQGGAMIAFIIALAVNIGSYWFSDRIVLAMYRAKPVSKEEAPQLYAIVEELTADAGLPMPRICVVPQGVPNAFATGRSPAHAAVCVTEGIMDMLNGDELKGVLAHELAHVKNRDTLIMSVAAAVAGAIMMLANMARWAAIFGGGSRDRDRSGNGIALLAVVILAPIAAMIVQLAISRTREYAADRRGAHFAHSSNGLASALKKLDYAARHYRMAASPQTAHMFIVNPLRGDFLATLFSTHPPTEKRIERLESLKI